VAGALEEQSLQSLVAFTGRLAPSGLSGKVASSAVGTAQTLARAGLDAFAEHVPDDLEAEIGRVKFANFQRFAALSPEYRYVFVGESGQADALTAQLMLQGTPPGGSARVLTTFIHDLRQSDTDRGSASPAFRALPAALVVGRSSAGGRGVIVFRNYIDAAVIAHGHAATLGDLVTPEQLARITRVALEEFQAVGAPAGEPSGHPRLRDQYREDAEAARVLLARVVQRSSALEDDVKAVAQLLSSPFWRE
jgi:hypothetical protein